MTDKLPGEKQFSLKPIELNLIANKQSRAQAEMFDTFSFIAMERLAYNVTQRTQFRIDNGILFISELPEDEGEDVSVATAEEAK